MLDRHDQLILAASGGSAMFYYHPIMRADIEALGFTATKSFVNDIVAGKLGYTARPDARLRENGLANPWLRPSIITFPCNEQREGWIKDKFVKEHIPNLGGYSEVYRYSLRMHNWFLRMRDKLR
jgi:hypothetical protein